ncbi:MAG: hypothetical protein EA422_07200 [Gemmatimonadales bacterium]|nr:MAG: hypothetical protein EA422_07200 [Gemmatimonadales bacterium]
MRPGLRERRFGAHDCPGIPLPPLENGCPAVRPAPRFSATDSRRSRPGSLKPRPRAVRFPWLTVVALLAASLASAVPLQAQDYDYRYHTYAEKRALLEAWTAAHPELARLESLGPSQSGTMEIWAVELTNRATGPASEKPAAFFDGNQHDSEVMAGEVALHLVWWLLTRYGSDPDVTELLDTRAVYVIPVANPEGAEWHITGEVTWNPWEIANRERLYGEGRRGADGPSDITGDGNILQMRIRDPDGDWTPHTDDPRLMVRRQEGDAGPFFRIVQEGLDDNGDGTVNSDPPFMRFITNRNYPAFWSSHDGRFRGAGDYPLDEPNSRIVVDYITARPNIGLIESYHTTSGVHLRPYAARPDSDMPQQDLQDYQAILAMAFPITGHPQASVYHQFTTIQPGLDPDEQPGARRGVFIDWAYAHFGAFANTTELWTMEPFVNEIGWGDTPRDEPLFAIPGRYNRPDVQLRILEWLDRNRDDPRLSGQGFVDWAPFDHPTLGEVEIGGWTRYWLRNAPEGPFLQESAVSEARFAVLRALKLPRARIRGVEVTEAGPNRWQVRVRATNEGWLDTSMQQARIAGVVRPDRLRIETVEGAGGPDLTPREFDFMRGTRGGSFESYYYGEWTVEGDAGSEVTLILDSQRGGTHRLHLPLEPRSMDRPVDDLAPGADADR